VSKASLAVRVLLVCGFSTVTPVSAAIFNVTNSFWGDTTSTGSFAWAIHQANITPGHDTIELLTNVSTDIASPITPFRLADITDPAGLRIQGNGHSLVGNPSYITPSGDVITKTNPQKYRSGDLQTVPSYSFALLSENISEVVVDGLTVDGLNSFMNIGRGTTVSVLNSVIKYMGDFGQRPAPIFEAFESTTLNLKNVLMSHINTFQSPIRGSEYIWFPAITGQEATLNMEGSTLDLVSSSIDGGITWNGGLANIVSSLIYGKGLSITDYNVEGVLNMVNSVFRPYYTSATARIQAFNGGVANVIASTIQFDASGLDVPGDNSSLLGCPLNYKCAGAPLQAFSGGTINLASSAVSVINTDFSFFRYPYSNTYANTIGALVADAYSFVQPVTLQDSAILESLFSQPNLLTSGVPYALDPSDPSYPPTYYQMPDGAYPLVLGPLVNKIPDADGTNQLINPIDGSVIRSDVFGNPRSSNGLRDVGAVQHSVPGPQQSVPGPLPMLGIGSAFGWSRRLRRRLGKHSQLHQ